MPREQHPEGVEGNSWGGRGMGGLGGLVNVKGGLDTAASPRFGEDQENGFDLDREGWVESGDA